MHKGMHDYNKMGIDWYKDIIGIQLCLSNEVLRKVCQGNHNQGNMGEIKVTLYGQGCHQFSLVIYHLQIQLTFSSNIFFLL